MKVYVVNRIVEGCCGGSDTEFAGVFSARDLAQEYVSAQQLRHQHFKSATLLVEKLHTEFRSREPQPTLRSGRNLRRAEREHDAAEYRAWMCRLHAFAQAEWPASQEIPYEDAKFSSAAHDDLEMNIDEVDLDVPVWTLT